MAATAYAADIESVRAAADRIRPFVHRTAILRSQAFDRMAGREVLFKCEPFQRVGAFKFRGACNAILRLVEAGAPRAVVTHSSGNHAQAVALAARMQGIDAHIVMPTTASPVKRAAVEGYGAVVHPCEPTLEAREATARQVIDRTGASFVPPYDHPDIIAGQGTAALELIEDGGPLDAIITPVGGGGLLSGTCITTRSITPETRIFAAEPTGADDAARSMAAGQLIPQTDPRTICDGLLTSLGTLTWPIIRDHVERIFTIDDPQVIDAMRLLMERLKIVVEPSAAIAASVVLDPAFGALDGLQRVGVILSGGNVDLSATFDRLARR